MIFLLASAFRDWTDKNVDHLKVDNAAVSGKVPDAAQRDCINQLTLVTTHASETSVNKYISDGSVEVFVEIHLAIE